MQRAKETLSEVAACQFWIPGLEREVQLTRVELQSLIAEIQVDVRAGKRLRLGVSAGAAVFPHDGTTYEQLLADADHLMYRDKAARRGHVTLPAASAGAEFIATDMIDRPIPVQPRVPLPRLAS